MRLMPARFSPSAVSGQISCSRLMSRREYRRVPPALRAGSISPDSISLTVEQNVLTVRAERAPAQPGGAGLLIAERRYGTYTRQVFLGETLDADKIAADYAAGVLTLTIPVHEAAKPRSIQITSSDQKQAVSA
jgi:HSP20 family protein